MFFFAVDSKEIEWTGLKFSPDGKSILISTNGSVIKLIDSYNGSSLQTFTGNLSVDQKQENNIWLSPGHLNSRQLPLEASFSPDSQFVISGSSDGRIHIWNSDTGTKVCVLNGDHHDPVQCVQVLDQTIQSNSLTQYFSSIPSTWWWPPPAVKCPSGYLQLRMKISCSVQSCFLMSFLSLQPKQTRQPYDGDRMLQTSELYRVINSWCCW